MTKQPERLSKTKPARLLLDPNSLKRDPNIRARAVHKEWVQEEYAALLRAGVKLHTDPVVFRDPEGVLWVADGTYTIGGAIDAGLGKIACLVYAGSREDAAVYYCTRANRPHGMRRTPQDKQQAVVILLGFPRYAAKTINAMVTLTGFSHTTIEKARCRMGLDKPEVAEDVHGRPVPANYNGKANYTRNYYLPLQASPSWPTPDSVVESFYRKMAGKGALAGDLIDALRDQIDAAFVRQASRREKSA